MPHKQGIRANLKEGAPALCTIYLLNVISAEFHHYKWFPPTTTLYIWTILWLAAACCHLPFRCPTGPLMVACHGWWRNLYMLWDMYGMLGEKKSGCYTVSSREVFCAGAFTIVAIVGSHYLTTRVARWRPAPRREEGAETEKQGDEKA